MDSVLHFANADCAGKKMYVSEQMLTKIVNAIHRHMVDHTPNEETIKALEEKDMIVFDSVDEMFRDLDNMDEVNEKIKEMENE